MEAGNDSDCTIDSGSTDEAEATTASEALGTNDEDADERIEDATDAADATLFVTVKTGVLRTVCVFRTGVDFAPPLSSMTRSQIFLTCGSTYWRRWIARNCANRDNRTLACSQTGIA